MLANKNYAQTKNLEQFDYARWIHFGFTLGTNIANFKYQLSDSFYFKDSIRKVSVHTYPGITIGAISDIHIFQYFDLRIMPSLVIADRTLAFQFRNGTSIDKNIESISAEVPVLLKYKSVRHNNMRFYVLGGGKFGYDFSSNSAANHDPGNPLVALEPWNYYYEFGCGLDMYFYYFKFSPEIKMSKGLNNILAPGTDIYSKSFKKIYSNFIYFSLHFEG